MVCRRTLQNGHRMGNVKIFVFQLSAYQRESTAEEALNIIRGRSVPTCGCQSSPVTCLLNGSVYKVTMVADMEIMHGLSCLISPKQVQFGYCH